MTAEPEVRAGYEWLSQFVTQEGWSERRRKIQSHLLEVACPHDSPIGSEEFRSVSIAADRFGWYLHLAETCLDHPESYEVIQGARVIPVLVQLGAQPSLLELETPRLLLSSRSPSMLFVLLETCDARLDVPHNSPQFIHVSCFQVRLQSLEQRLHRRAMPLHEARDVALVNRHAVEQSLPV